MFGMQSSHRHHCHSSQLLEVSFASGIFSSSEPRPPTSCKTQSLLVSELHVLTFDSEEPLVSLRLLTTECKLTLSPRFISLVDGTMQQYENKKSYIKLFYIKQTKKVREGFCNSNFG